LQRHLSFLETGRSQPTPEMVIHLGTVLDMPLRDRNSLLLSAGFAPAYTERHLDEPELDQVRHVLDTLLAAYDPYPAYAIDRSWDLVMANGSAMALMGHLVDADAPSEVVANVMRAGLHPLGVRRRISNWDEFATTLVHRLQREVAHNPHDETLAALLAEARAYPGVADLFERPLLLTGGELVVPVRVRVDGTDLELFTTIATIGAPYDVTLEELRLETLLPADAETEVWLRAAQGDEHGQGRV
jgi:hypothetical protein